MAILEESCMASADMQWLFYSSERVMAHGPLVFCCCCLFCFILFIWSGSENTDFLIIVMPELAPVTDPH